MKYDLLVSNAIKFLTSVAERPQYAELFSNEEILENICKKVLVPNMKLRGGIGFLTFCLLEDDEINSRVNICSSHCFKPLQMDTQLLYVY